MKSIFCITTSLLLLIVAALASAAPVQRDHIEVDLLSENSRIAPGQPFWVALRLLPEEHWHTYWRNPGDSGLETRIDWQLPEGATADTIAWPAPQRFDIGGIINYGFDGETLLLTQITPPHQREGDTFHIVANANWLVCEDVCIPGQARLELELPYDGQPLKDHNWSPRFESARQALPTALSAEAAVFEIQNDKVVVEVLLPEGSLQQNTAVTFFPVDPDVIENASPQEIRLQTNTVFIQQEKSTYFERTPEQLGGVLVLAAATGETGAYEFSAMPGNVIIKTSQTSVQSEPMSITGLIHIFLFALLGGFILNLMPCVFPVLSLKGLSLVKNTKLSHEQQRMHGLSYTLGVVLSFIVIAAILLSLRAAGESIGWGFQLQSPWFVAALVYLLFVMGLSLSGLLEIGTSFMGIGQSLTERSGYSGSFFTGVLATVVATPCTAPFMGTAMGVAVTQPTLYALLIFAALGLGLASPFLLIAFVPSLTRFLPKPGHWMDVFKQLMAFPLYLTVIWLLWVLGRQTDINSLALVLTGMVLLVFAVWVWRVAMQGKKGLYGRIIALSAVVCALLILPLVSSARLPGGQNTDTETELWQVFSPQLLHELRSQGKPVFLNLTADWCITCKVNERMALSSEVFKNTLREKQIVYLKGDWTNRDPQITAVLEQFNRSGVPLYIVYPAGRGDPKVLPQLLTTDTVLDALNASAVQISKTF